MARLILLMRHVNNVYIHTNPESKKKVDRISVSNELRLLLNIFLPQANVPKSK